MWILNITVNLQAVYSQQLEDRGGHDVWSRGTCGQEGQRVRQKLKVNIVVGGGGYKVWVGWGGSRPSPGCYSSLGWYCPSEIFTCMLQFII